MMDLVMVCLPFWAVSAGLVLAGMTGVSKW